VSNMYIAPIIALCNTDSAAICRHDMRPSLKIALPVSLDVHNLSRKFERCMHFRFRVYKAYGGHRTAVSWTDDRSLTRNAAS